MQVERSTGIAQALLAAIAPMRLGGSRAAAPLPPKPAPTAPTPAPPLSSGAASVPMLVTLSATQAPEQRRGRLLYRAGEGVDELTRLHRELVRGAVPVERLRALRDWLKRRPRPDEPELSAFFDEIELRILVELAKLEP